MAAAGAGFVVVIAVVDVVVVVVARAVGVSTSLLVFFCGVRCGVDGVAVSKSVSYGASLMRRVLWRRTVRL